MRCAVVRAAESSAKIDIIHRTESSDRVLLKASEFLFLKAFVPSSSQTSSPDTSPQPDQARKAARKAVRKAEKKAAKKAKKAAPVVIDLTGDSP